MGFECTFRYNPSATREQDVKEALATFMLTLSEALRFTAIRELITEAWEGEAFLEKQMAEMVVTWGKASYCLYLWERTGVWAGRKACKDPRRVGMTDAVTALQKLDLLKRPQILSINSTVY